MGFNFNLCVGITFLIKSLTERYRASQGHFKQGSKVMTQNDEILKHLKEGNEINQLSALERFGCMRLAARILDLRSRGHKIETRIRKGHNGKVYASYIMEVNS